MFAKLSLPRLPIDALETVMTEGRSLCAEAAPLWHEVFVSLLGYRAARWAANGKPGFAEWLAPGLRRSKWPTPEASESVVRLIGDEEALRQRTEEKLAGALVESSRLGFWVNLGISSGVKEGQLWYEVRHADKIGSQRLTLGAPEDEPGETMGLSLEVREDAEASVQMFGPMLSALCFGRVLLGVHLQARPARIAVKLKLSAGDEQELTAAAALQELTALAEKTVPNILLF